MSPYCYIYPKKIKEWWSNAHAERSVNDQTSLSPSSDFFIYLLAIDHQTESEKKTMITIKPSKAIGDKSINLLKAMRNVIL